VEEDEAGIRSQGWLQGGWLATSPSEQVAGESPPTGHPAILYALVECAAGWLRGCSTKGRPALSHLSPRQRYALYRAAFRVLRDWPQGLFETLDGICGQDPHPSQRLNQLQQRWFQPNREGSEYHFLKQAFVAYRLSRGLPVPLAFAHRWKRADWFVECSGIWSVEQTAMALGLPVGELARFCPNGSLRDCLWSASPSRGLLFWRERVRAVQQGWRAGWSLADTGSWLGMDEAEVIHLEERGRLALKAGDPQEDPSRWLFERSTITDFFQTVIDWVKPYAGEPSYLCRRYELDRHLHSLGMDWALLIQHVVDGLLPAYQAKADIRALDEICFDVGDMDAWPDRWYALQGLVSDRGFAQETMVSPRWIERWVAANWIAPVLNFDRVQYFDRAELERLVATLNIFET